VRKPGRRGPDLFSRQLRPDHGGQGVKIAFAGLGVMGAPTAGHLVRAGHEVAGYNRSPGKARAWAEATGGRFCATIAEAAQGVEVFVLCVGNDADVREVVTAAVSAVGSGCVFVDHTTTSAAVAREMARLAADWGCSFV